MIRCMIIDDEPLAHEVLEAHILRHGRLQLVAKCSNAPDAFKMLHTEQIDLMFLDIRMPSINGLDFLRSLKDPPQVIFTTAYAEYAHTGFEMDAVDYLLKPVSYERFEKAIRKFFRQKSGEQEEKKQYTYFKVSGRLIKVAHKELIFAQSVKDYIQLKTTQGSFLTHMTMKALTQLLPPEKFVRVHRSYLVNLDFVDRIERNGLIVSGSEIVVGESYRDVLSQLWRSGGRR